MTGVMKVCSVAAVAMLGAGMVMAEEKTAGPRGNRGGDPEVVFKAMDKDGNGSISLDEFKAAHEKRVAAMKERMGDKWDESRASKMPSSEDVFKKTDADSDGAVTLEEMKQAREKRREMMGEHRRGQGEGGKRGHGGDDGSEDRPESGAEDAL